MSSTSNDNDFKHSSFGVSEFEVGDEPQKSSKFDVSLVLK
jgi:hypothetical protein